MGEADPFAPGAQISQSISLWNDEQSLSPFDHAIHFFHLFSPHLYVCLAFRTTLIQYRIKRRRLGTFFVRIRDPSTTDNASSFLQLTPHHNNSSSSLILQQVTHTPIEASHKFKNDSKDHLIQPEASLRLTLISSHFSFD